MQLMMKCNMLATLIPTAPSSAAAFTTAKSTCTSAEATVQTVPSDCEILMYDLIKLATSTQSLEALQQTDIIPPPYVPPPPPENKNNNQYGWNNPPQEDLRTVPA